MKRLLLGLLLAMGLMISPSLFAQSDPEGQFFDLINAYRASQDVCFNGEQPVGWGAAPRTLARSFSLDLAARSHAQTMSASGCFEHQCPGEPDPLMRLRQAGHQGWNWVAENVARGTNSADEAFGIWRQSHVHDINMLACQARSIGIAQVNGWWTTVFTDSTISDPPPPPPSGNACFKLDANGNNVIDDDEIGEAIRLWIVGDPLCK